MIISDSTNAALSSTTEIFDDTINLNSLYCSHLWTNSKLRKGIINSSDEHVISRCYSCNGKIRKYEIISVMNNFTPKTYSTPNVKTLEMKVERNTTTNFVEEHIEGFFLDKITPDEDINKTYGNLKQCIPSISQQIDLNIGQKFTSYDNKSNERNQRKLKKSLKHMGCAVKFGLTDSPVKKRTQIRACSISIMVVAIVVISFILINFTTPAFTRVTKINKTTIVPTNILNENKTFVIHVESYTDISILTLFNATEYTTSVDDFKYSSSTENVSLLSSIISKIRKNIKTYPKEASKNKSRSKPKDINNRDLSQRFCSCQNNEICMLDENSGKSICRQPIDEDDPTGCGGLCALETEACQVVDKELGVRVCRLLMLSTCSPQEWRCRNGLCVPAASRCDGSIQCYDRSDEVQCECDLSRQFRCGQSISCFSKIKLCDGIIDCWDGFDEVNCTTECPTDMSTCTDGQCILSTRFCDGLTDCEDGSDEPNGCDGDCGAREIRCKNGRCVLRTVLCDGQDNCGDASDEMNCS